MMSVERSPALHKCFKLEPQVAGMEASRIVSGDGYTESIVVEIKPVLSAYRGHQSVADAHLMHDSSVLEFHSTGLYSFLESLRVLAEFLVDKLIDCLLIVRFRSDKELVLGVAYHELDIIHPVADYGIFHHLSQEDSVSYGAPEIMALVELVLDVLCVKSSGFLQSLYSELLEELDAFLFLLLERHLRHAHVQRVLGSHPPGYGP